MYTNELLRHIHDMNLSYLLLASSLINNDKTSAMFRLGVSEDIADLLSKLTLTQMQKLTQTNQLICKIRFPVINSITYLTQESRLDGLKHVHAGILLSSHLINEKSEGCNKQKRPKK